MTSGNEGTGAAGSGDNPARVVMSITGDAHQIRLYNARAIADALTPEVFGAFLKCFMGMERILTFEHLMYLNHQAAKTPDALSDEHAHDRNNNILGFLLAGTMHEMGAALQQLCNARVAVDPAMRAAWEPLDKLRAEWNTNEYASMIRNQFVFHLGGTADYAKGIGRLGDPVLFEATNKKRGAGRFWATWEALWTAHGIDPVELDAFVRRTQEAHTALPNLLFKFFVAVLRHRGVPYIVEQDGEAAHGR